MNNESTAHPLVFLNSQTWLLSLGSRTNKAVFETPPSVP